MRKHPSPLDLDLIERRASMWEDYPCDTHSDPYGPTDGEPDFDECFQCAIIVFVSDIRSLMARVREVNADVEAAAGELIVPVPEPGTDMARMMVANRLMMRERDEARSGRNADRAEAAELLASMEEELDDYRSSAKLHQRSNMRAINVWAPDHPSTVIGDDPQRPEFAVMPAITGNGPTAPENAKFIANARTDVPWLCRVALAAMAEMTDLNDTVQEQSNVLRVMENAVIDATIDGHVPASTAAEILLIDPSELATLLDERRPIKQARDVMSTDFKDFVGELTGEKDPVTGHHDPLTS